MLSRGRTLT